MPSKKKTEEVTRIDVPAINREIFTVRIVGVAPLIYNAIAEKARRELLLPRGRKTAAEKAVTAKHDPYSEFRNSVYARLGDGPTRLTFPATAFKNCLVDAALDLPTAVAKAKLQRLTYVQNEYVDIYGLPMLFMTTVRNSDINHTPDIRTRALLPEWACEITLAYTTPMLNKQAVANLLAAGGMICGIGDYRQQKGGGSYGLFDIVDEGDDRYRRITEQHGLVAQDEALKAATPHDHQTEQLLSWYDTEFAARFEEAATAKKKATPKKKAKRSNGASVAAAAN